MHLAFQCDGAINIEPFIQQLQQQGVACELRNVKGSDELWLEDASLIKPVTEFYGQYILRQQQTLSVKNLKGTPITAAILLFSTAVALITMLGSNFTEYFLIARMQFDPRAWFLYDGLALLWHSVAPIFLHFSIEHLIFNMLSFWYLGSSLERNLPRLYFISMLLLCALFSNYGQLYSSGPLFGGLSGVVYGFMGFAFIYQKFYQRLNIPNGLFYMAFIWLLLGFSNVLVSIGLNMANTAHLVGMLCGLLNGFLFVIFMKNFKKGEFFP